jgi:hypothetical protein
MLDLDKVDLSSLVIDGVDHADHPDYCDAYYSYGEFTNGLTMTDEQLEQFKEICPDLFYEMLTNTIY